MLKLHARLPEQWDEEPFLLRVGTATSPEGVPRHPDALLRADNEIVTGARLHLPRPDTSTRAPGSSRPEYLRLPESFNYLTDGDILRISPTRGEVWVMYRRNSRFNSMLLTERCNSLCVMCSQPPKTVDDSYLVEAFLDAIPLMSPDTPELGITGGEPTLLGKRLLDLIAACRDALPQTALHMLSNGRLFQYLSLCQDLAEIGHPDFMIGIPLYSDLAHRHDFVVQARGAFDETIRGFMNLQRCGIRTELRVVLHRGTVDRLPHLARFIARNLPFVEHVALMGLEMMGFVRMNLEALWIDPVDYQPQLVESVRTLCRHGMNVSIYNHQLCVLDRELWPFARRSISDWKNEYLDECATCAAREDCGGFFSSSHLRRSDHLRTLSPEEVGTPHDLPATF